MIGRLAANHFLKRGYHHYAWASLMDDIVNAERDRGFANRLAEEGFTCNLLPPADTRHRDSVKRDWMARRKLLKDELRRLPKPLAVFSYNDCMTIASCVQVG